LVKPIPEPRAIVNRTCLLAGGVVCVLLGLSACGSANPNLFDNSSAQPGIGGTSAGTGSLAGLSSSGAGAGAGAAGGSESFGGKADSMGLGASAGSGASAGNGGSSVGCAFSCGNAGGDKGYNLGGGGAGSGAAGADGDQAGTGSEPSECSAWAAGASFLPATQHCYLIDSEERTFAAAQAHCAELKAHLVTLGSEAESEFAWSIHPDEHWVGAKDGKSPKQSGVGTYTWITDEPFGYSNWSSDQPNASKTECVESGGDCYEHCAFQWTGGQHDGQWNDRYCMHTIASICERDSAP
jgi:lectin-like protein